MKTGETDQVIWDDELGGFGIRVKPSGVRSFIIQYRNRYNRSRRLTIGRYGIVTAAEARVRAKRLFAKVQEGIDPAQDVSDARHAPNFADLAERYLVEHAELKKRPKSVALDKSLLRLHVMPALGAMKVEAITRHEVSRLHHKMKNTPVVGNRALSLISKIMNLAEKWGLRPDGTNPCRHVEKYPERRMERFLTDDELARLGSTLLTAERAQTESPSVIAAIRLLILTGARVGEVLHLRWAEVDFERSFLRLDDSKTGAKVIHLGEAAVVVLRHLSNQPHSEWVIPGAIPNKPLVNLRKPWRRIRKIAELEGVRLHDLRHSFASVAAVGGLSLPMIGALLGHSQPATTARYAHLAANPVKQAADSVSNHIANALASNTT